MIDNTINDAVTIAGGEGTLLANRYRIVRQLGQGGMGNVWLVEDTQLDNKPFAVKMLPAILVANKRAYRQLKDEALVAMRLVHPNIVQIRAFEENNGNPFLVMDYIDGQTLDDYLAEHTGTTGVSPVAGGISEADVLRILTPIADALDYAHVEGVVHRDVKPANVMIRKDGHPFILDFGIAREIQETITRVTGKLSSGTLLYMSPEQLNGAQPRPAQDVYSFAAMVYECLKGEPPFVRGQIEFQILNEPPPSLNLPTTGPSSRGSGTLAASVMSGLAKKPEDRPATCAAVLRGSGAPAASVRTVNGSGKSGASPRPQHPGRSHLSRPSTGGSRSCATAAILIAVFLVIIGGVWWLGRGWARESTETRGVADEVARTTEVAEVKEKTKPTVNPSPPSQQTNEFRSSSDDDLVFQRQKLEQAIARSDYATAVKYADAVLHVIPDDPYANFAIGMDHFAKKAWGRAIEYLMRSVKQKPDEPVFLNNLSIALLYKGCYDDAFKYAQRALIIQPDSEIVKDTVRQIENIRAHVVKEGRAQTNAESAVGTSLRVETQNDGQGDKDLKALPCNSQTSMTNTVSGVNRIITNDDWENAKKSLKFAGKIRQNGRLGVVINGKVYEEGDLVSITHDEIRFTWRVEGLNDAKLRLVRLRAKHLLPQ